MKSDAITCRKLAKHKIPLPDNVKSDVMPPQSKISFLVIHADVNASTAITIVIADSATHQNSIDLYKKNY